MFSLNKVTNLIQWHKLQEVHGIGKELDLNILPEKQVIKPIITSEAKGISQIKPSLGQDRAGLRWKTNLPMSPHG